MIRKGWADVQTLKAAAPTRAEVQALAAGIKPKYESLREGTPYLVSPDNVVRQNSLQISHAERWVYSSTDDFSLAERMIKENPRFRRGGRNIVGGPWRPPQEDAGAE